MVSAFRYKVYIVDLYFNDLLKSDVTGKWFCNLGAAIIKSIDVLP
jgi:hypothetical protein